MKYQRVSSGQGIVFLAVMILIFIAFAGLAIDTGQAFARQRTIQASANASAVAGMNAVLLDNSDSEVAQTIAKTMAANGVPISQQVTADWGTDKDKVYYRAIYLNAAGEPIGFVGDRGSATAPAGTAHLIVETGVDVSTSFANVVGVDKFSVSAEGAAGKGNCVIGVFPITFHKKYLQNDATISPPRVAPVPMPDPFVANSAIPASSKFTVWRESSPGITVPTGNFLWLTWTSVNGGGGQGGGLGASLTGAGNLGDGFEEATPPAFDTAAIPLMNGQLEIGDWMMGQGGNNATISVPQLDYHITNKTQMILPVHDNIDGNGDNAKYRASAFVKVRLVSYDVTGQNKHFVFALIQANTLCPIQETNVPPTSKNTFEISLNEKLLWYKPGAPGGNYDIAIVLDYSYSMRYCWDTDTTKNGQCSAANNNRRIDYATPVMRSFVDEMLVKRNSAAVGGDNRLALVTFGHYSGNNVVAKTRIAFGTDTAATVTKFQALYGTDASPIKVQDTELAANTPIAHGVYLGFRELDNARKVDKYGKPVSLSILLITDGLSNVLFGDAHSGTVNKYNVGPYFCGDAQSPKIDSDLDNPIVQSTCPRGPEFGEARSPVRATIETIEAERSTLAAKGRTFTLYAVVISGYGGYSIQDLQVDKMADVAVVAETVAQFQSIVDGIEQALATPCVSTSDPARDAAGASVTITRVGDANGLTYTANSDGKLTVELVEGDYHIAARHLNVISPNDPLSIARNYTKMSTLSSPSLVSNITVTMPNKDYAYPEEVLLTIDNPANGKCPVPPTP